MTAVATGDLLATAVTPLGFLATASATELAEKFVQATLVTRIAALGSRIAALGSRIAALATWIVALTTRVVALATGIAADHTGRQQQSN